MALSQPLQQQGTAKVRVSVQAPASIDQNVSLPVTVSVAPADESAASIRDALKEYGVTTVRVTLGGPAFSVSPADPQESQWVGEDNLQWSWAVGANTPGPQTLLVTVSAKGKPSWSSDVVEGPIWSGPVQITVNGSSGFDLSKLDFFAPMNSLAGMGLTLPWIYEQIQKRRKRRALAKVEQPPATG